MLHPREAISVPCRVLLLSSACWLAFGMLPSSAMARTLLPSKPSVEVNLDVLEGLAEPADAVPNIGYPQQPVSDVPFGRASAPVAGRKVPAEQPGHAPVHTAPKVTKPKPKPALKPVPKPEPKPEAREPLPQAEAPLPPPPSSAPAPELAEPMPSAPPLMAAPQPIAKPAVPAAAAKPLAPAPEELPLPLPPVGAVAPVVPRVSSEPPAPSVNGLDFSKLPPPSAVAPAPAAKPPAPLPPLPSTSTKPAAGATLAPPPIPPIAAPSTGMQLPPPPLPKAPVVLVPSEAASPLMVPVNKEPPPLPPSVTQRLDTMNGSGLKEGTSERTKIERPAEAMKETIKRQQQEQKAAADKAAADKAAAAKLHAIPPAPVAGTEKLPPAELPAPSKPIILNKTEIAAPPKLDAHAIGQATPSQRVKPEENLPPPTLPTPVTTLAPKPAGGIAPVPPPPGGLPTLPVPTAISKTSNPNLPSLTPIVGDRATSSMDILQPREGVDSKPLAPPPGITSAPPLPTLPVALPSTAGEGPVVKHGEPVKAATPLPAVQVEQGVKVETATKVTPPPAPALPPPPSATPAKPAANVPAVAAGPSPAPTTPGSSTAATGTPPPLNVPALGAESSESSKSSVGFAKDTTELSDDAKGQLNGIADKVKASQGSVRVIAYASGTADEASMARRVSLSRALSIRAFLISKGVNQLSINVQALGNQVPGGPADRADVFVK